VVRFCTLRNFSGTTILKLTRNFALAAFCLSISLVASAQSAQTVTRDQVRNEMIQYEKAGFNPSRANPQTWVADAQAAAARVNASNDKSSDRQFAAGTAISKCD
jgi:hypothetical protein